MTNPDTIPLTDGESTDRPRTNPNAIHPATMDYSALRRRYLRNHTAVDHDWDDYYAIHIDPRLPGVKP